MGSIDYATWQALGLVLTVLGLVLSFAAYRRRGAAAGLRGAAWSLIPLAAALTGTLRLVWDVADSVTSWAANLVFNPLVWTGIAVAGVSAALFVVSGTLRRHGGGKARGKAAKEPKAAKGKPAAVPAQSSRGTAAVQDDDMADIEAILKKHGIS